MFEPSRSSRYFSCEYDKKQCSQYNFSSPLGREWGAWPKSDMAKGAKPGAKQKEEKLVG